MKSSNSSGFSLLEALLAIVILTLAVWSVSFLYVGLLQGTKGGEARRQAVASAETVFQVWRRKALKPWPKNTDPATEAYASNGEYNEYLYRVEVGGRITNPTYDSTNPRSEEYLDMRLLKVTLHYDEDNKPKKVVINGSVSK